MKGHRHRAGPDRRPRGGGADPRRPARRPADRPRRCAAGAGRDLPRRRRPAAEGAGRDAAAAARRHGLPARGGRAEAGAGRRWCRSPATPSPARRCRSPPRCCSRAATPSSPPRRRGINVSRRLKDEDRRAALLALADARRWRGSAMGLILRSEAETGDDAAIAADIAAMLDAGDADDRRRRGASRSCCSTVPARIGRPGATGRRPDLLDEAAGSFARHGVADLLDAAAQPRVALGGGAHGWIEPTRALVAVDVNTGADTSPAAGLKANLALARDLPRQLRLRGLGGQIVLDLAPMPKKDRVVVRGPSARRVPRRPDRDGAGRLDAAGPFRTAAQARTPAAAARSCCHDLPDLPPPDATRTTARSARNAAPMSISAVADRRLRDPGDRGRRCRRRRARTDRGTERRGHPPPAVLTSPGQSRNVPPQFPAAPSGQPPPLCLRGRSPDGPPSSTGPR